MAQEESPHEECLHGAGQHVRVDGRHAAAPVLPCIGNDDRRFRGRPHPVGHRFDLVGLAAMADRGAAPPGDARLADEAIRLQAAQRGGQAADLRLECGARLRDRPEGEEKPSTGRLCRSNKEALQAGRNSAEQHPVRLGSSVTRRAFLATSLSAAAIGPAKVIDCHAHLTHRSWPSWETDDRKLVDAADKLGIDQLCCSILTPRRPATAEGFRECNQWVAEAMRRFPGRVLGYCYVNPGYGREASDEIRRCVEDRGFAGIKLYNEYRVNEPVVRPVIELAIELRVPILHHAGHASWLPQPQPHISDGGHLADAARRYPEAMLICGHIGGGGDWEWTIK